MEMIRMKAPPGVTCIGHYGAHFDVDRDGWVNVPDSLVKAFEETHKCKRVESVITSNLTRLAEKTGKPLTAEEVANMEKKDLLQYCLDHDIEIVGKRIPDIRAAVVQHSRAAAAKAAGKPDDQAQEDGQAEEPAEPSKDKSASAAA